MRYIKNLRSYDATETTDPVSLSIKATVPKEAQKNKAAFRKWSGDESTDHVFLSANEGIAANQRITTDNPIHTCHGLICDYDGATDWDEIESQVTKVCPHPPTYIATSFSGCPRIIWMFEEAIPVDPEIYPTFIKELGHVLSAEKVTYGLDPCSFKPDQYFEIGKDWKEIGGFVPSDLVKGLVCKASGKVRPLTDDVAIPISEIAEEVEKQFPDRWKKDFSVGSRGPLFWIDDGIDREGCVIREDGVTCFSDRAGKGFLSWKEILGPKFVKEYETKKLAPILDTYWYDGSTFYKLMGASPLTVTERQVTRELRQRGFSNKPKKDEPLSEIDNTILAIQNQNRVDLVAPILFQKDRVVDHNSLRILNSARNAPVLPSDDGDPKNWPFIHGWLNQLFVDPDTAASGGPCTLDYIYSWLARIYLSVLGRYPAQGQALLLVGPTGRGKTLLSNLVMGGLLGGCEDASDYLAGKTSFNKLLCGRGLWVIDDTVSAASFQDQRKATELIKRTVANPKVDYHAKYVDAMTLPWTGRVILSLNMDSNSLSVIPSLDSSNRDKVMAVRIADTSTEKFPPNHVVETTVERELPHFARFLADWSMPDSVKGQSRFGVASFIDPMIVSAAFDNSPRASIAELVDWFVKQVRASVSEPFWQGTITEFQTTVVQCNDGRHLGHSHNVEFVRRGIATMEEGFRQEPGKHRPVLSHGDGGGKTWAISLDEAYDLKGPASMGAALAVSATRATRNGETADEESPKSQG
jgi:hypothetical protein